MLKVKTIIELDYQFDNDQIDELKKFLDKYYDIYDYDVEYEEKLIFMIIDICLYCKKNNIDILWHIEQKMKYNELSPMLNGKKY